MTYYDSFDCKINCEDLNAVSEEDFNAVMLEIAQEREARGAYGEWSEGDQRAWEAEQERLKNWTGDYSPIDEGEAYEGIAI